MPVLGRPVSIASADGALHLERVMQQLRYSMREPLNLVDPLLIEFTRVAHGGGLGLVQSRTWQGAYLALR